MKMKTMGMSNTFLTKSTVASTKDKKLLIILVLINISWADTVCGRFFYYT